MNYQKSCGIVIPVYNSPNHLEELLGRISQTIKQCPDWRFSVLLVDDGSSPPLPQLTLPGLSSEQIHFEENRGKGVVLKKGFEHFLKSEDTAAVISIDADLQHPPEKIPAFLKAFEEDRGDIIVGNRKRTLTVMPFHRIISNTLTTAIISVMIRQNVFDSQCGFRLYSRRVLETVTVTENRFHLESEFLIRSGWQKFKIGCVPIPTIYNNAPSAIRNLPDTLNFITVSLKLTMGRIRGNV